MNSNLVEKTNRQTKNKKGYSSISDSIIFIMMKPFSGILISKTFSFVLQSPTSNNLTHGLIFWGNKFNNLMHSTSSERMSPFDIVLVLYSYS